MPAWHSLFWALNRDEFNRLIFINRMVMTQKFLTPAVIFMMKYFFDVEKEITQQVLFSAKLRLNDCKEAVEQLGNLVTANR
jgi:hypothetical protein